MSNKFANLAGKNPFEGFSPEVPQGEKLVIGDDDFLALEKLVRHPTP